MNILEPEQVIRGTYKVERPIGTGAFAQVYRVKHRFMGRQAMKVFNAPDATIEEIERDISEAVLLSSLKHPNIIEVFDANVLESHGRQYGYFTMSYMPGGTLDRYWRSYGNDLMPVDEVVAIVCQLCRGAALAHSANPPIVHRDIKPQNILVGFSNEGVQVRLSDFGLAKAVNPLTMLVTARGTLGFKPPESMHNSDSCAADVWAIGTVLYLLLTDVMPFPLLDERDIEDAGCFLRPMRPPSIYNIHVDAGLESIIFKCLATDAADRYANAGDLLSDIERWKPNPGSKAIGVGMSSFQSKLAMSGESQDNLKQEADEALNRALIEAQDSSKLFFAADLLEEAISKDPNLRDRYESQLILWRKGIMHCPIINMKK